MLDLTTMHFQNKLKPARIFKGSVDPPTSSSPTPHRSTSQAPRMITSISFDDRGDYLMTAGDDETFRLYSCKTGK